MKWKKTYVTTLTHVAAVMSYACAMPPDLHQVLCALNQTKYRHLSANYNRAMSSIHRYRLYVINVSKRRAANQTRGCYRYYLLYAICTLLNSIIYLLKIYRPCDVIKKVKHATKLNEMHRL